MPAFQVLRPSAVESRFEARQERGVVPLVGREEELELLLRRWRQACAGESRVVLLTGEPGIGKSRIIRELQDRVAHEPHLRLRYFCSPQRQDSALYPFVSQLEQASGFSREDSAAEKLAKLKALLAQSNATDEEIALVAALLSLRAGEQLPDMGMQQDKERTLQALLVQLERLAAMRPVLVVFEDAHWIDPDLPRTDLADRSADQRADAAADNGAAGIRPALAKSCARDDDHTHTAGAPGGGEVGGSGSRRQASASGGAGPNPGTYRRGTAVCRGAHENGPRRQSAARRGRSLRDGRPTAALGYSDHTARLTDGTVGPPGSFPRSRANWCGAGP